MPWVLHLLCGVRGERRSLPGELFETVDDAYVLGLERVNERADSDVCRLLSTVLLAGYSNFHVNHVGLGREFSHVSFAVELKEEERAQGGTMDQR